MNDMTAGMDPEQQMAEEERLALLTPEELAAEQAQAIEEANANLVGAVEAAESSAFGGEDDPVSTQRARAIDYYLGEETLSGDIINIDGRSRYISKDTYDTIEWIKPPLMRIFAAGEQVCTFSPQGEEDIEGAEQESNYVDYVIQRKNPWFMVALEWFGDALLTRNAYCLAFWEKRVEASLERYQGMTDDQMALVAMDESVEIVEHNSYQAEMPIPAHMMLQLMQAGVFQQFGPPPPITMHDFMLRRRPDYGCVRLCVLPPERCLVAHDTKGMSVRQGNFFEFWEYKTLSKLREDGFDVADDISDTGGIDSGVVDQARDTVTQAYTQPETEYANDPSMRKVKARMVWIRTDYDSDGIAELRYVVLVGSTVLANQEVTGIPVACIVPTPMPHRHIGLSMHDAVGDLQLIKTALMRGVVDNQFLGNNGRYGVNKNLVNLDDMLISRPGGTVRVDGPPGENIMPFTHPQTAQAGIAVIEYLDSIRQDRGGVQKPAAGADLTSIMAQPGTVAQLSAAASQKIELVARILGEGVKELFSIVHELTLTNKTMPEKVELNSKWITVDPRQWKKRHDMTLSVGMGVVSRPQQVGGLAQLLTLQKEALPQGLTSYQKIYTTLSKFAEALGFASGKQFFTEPPPDAKYQAPQDPLIVATQINASAKVATEEMKNTANAGIAMMKEESANARTYFETMLKQQNEAQERFVRMMSEMTDRMQEIRLEGARTPPKVENTVQVAGLSELGAAVEKVAGMTERVGEHARAAGEAVREIKAAGERKRKRRVTTDKGRKYTVEDTD